MKTLLEDREDRVVDQSPVAPPSAVRGGRRAGDSEVISRKGVIRTYRRYAPVYDWLFGAILQPGRRELAAAVHRFDVRSVLEVGVGTGLTLQDYPGHCELAGIDLCEEMLQKARRKVMHLTGRRIRLEVMDGESMTFADSSFDCIAVPYVLSVTPHPERLVSEIRRVCRPGGIILIVNHFSGSRFWRGFEAAVGRVAQSIGFRSEFDFDEHILGHDWQVVSVRPVNLLGLSRLVAIRNS